MFSSSIYCTRHCAGSCETISAKPQGTQGLESPLEASKGTLLRLGLGTGWADLQGLASDQGGPKPLYLEKGDSGSMDHLWCQIQGVGHGGKRVKTGTS